MIKYIFCISPGRSGSDYLSGIFQHAENCCSTHEPDPPMHDLEMRQFLKGNQKPMRALLPGKLAAISRARAGAGVYVETNHCFIKGFGWLLAETLPNEEIGVIVLRREREKVVDSLCRIECTPATRFGRSWLITPAARNCLVPLPGPYSRLRWWAMEAHRFLFDRRIVLAVLRRDASTRPQWMLREERRLTEWYVDETYARGDLFRDRYPDIRYADVHLDELNTEEGVVGLFSAFGLVAKPSLLDAVGKPTNLKRKRETIPDLTATEPGP